MLLATAAAVKIQEEPIDNDMIQEMEMTEAEAIKEAAAPKFDDCQMVQDERNGRMLLAYKGKLHPVPDRETFNDLFKPSAWYNNLVVEDGEAIDKALSGAITDDAYLGRTKDSEDIFLVSGKSYHIVNEKTFAECQFNWDKVREIPPAWAKDL